MPEKVDFFIHIPKTAGTTMAQVIESQYPKDAVLSFRDARVSEEERVEMVKAMGPQIRIVAGHLHYGHAKLFPRDCRPFTMLRDPTERMISLYYYIGREPRHPTHEAFKRGEVTIEKLASRQGRAQACFIAGMAAKDACPDDELIARAKENLEKVIVSVGLTERFDESLLLYNRALGWNVQGYVRVNVTKNRPRQESLAASDIAIIRENSVVDQEIYDFAKGLFEGQIAKMPPTFADELASLKRKITVARGVSWVRSGFGRVKEALAGRRE